MDYEKKYNEALERARALWREAIEKEYAIDYLKDYETIFPELRESEDERIGKEIINYLDFAESHNLLRATDYEKKKGWLDWLDRKKMPSVSLNPALGFDPGSAVVYHNDEDEDERIRKALIDGVSQIRCKGDVTREQMIAYLEKQQEIPMPNSTELIEMWDKEEAMLKEKDFRGDTWRIAYNAFMDGFAKGTCVKFEKQKSISQEDFDTAKHEALGEQNRDFTIYHPLKNGNGKYECIPYSFYGSLSAFSEDKALIDFLRTCFYTKEECEEWIKQKEQKPRKFKLGDKIHWKDDDTNVITITGFRDDAYLTDSAYGPILFCDEDNWERIEQKPADDTAFEKWIDDWFQGSKGISGYVVMNEKEFKNWSRGIKNMYQQKLDIALIQRSWYMEGYHDREFGMEPMWIIKTGEGGPKHELNPKYGQLLDDEQKPAEKQDYSGLTDLERAIHRGFLSAGVENVPVTIIKETAKDCLAQMKPADLPAGFYVTLPDGEKYYAKEMRCRGMNIKVVEPKPAEWSEEDEKMWMDIKSHMIHGSFIPFDKIEWIENRLKSLRPSWRPSEEDIKMLEHIIGQYETGNKNSKVMGYLPRVEELSFLKKVLSKWKN